MEQAPHVIALNKAKIALMSRLDSVFFMHLAFSLIHQFDDTIRTAATNGKFIKYSPEFFMSLDPEERVFLMLHETMHVAYMHMARTGDRCPDKFNIAADHVINLQLIERGFKMPKCGLADPQYSGLSTEEVYNLLPPSPSGGNQGVPGFGSDLLSPEDSHDQLAAEVQDMLVRAAIHSKLANDKPGIIPGEIEIFLNKLLNPKLPWNRILQKYLNTFSKNDYSFRKPNRRFFPDHFMPSLYGEKLMNIVVAVDTSGSVSDEEFHRFVSETHSILRMMKPEQITVIQFDTEIKSVDKVQSTKDLMGISFTGRGGTDIDPVLEWANTHKPQLLLVFSDGEFNFSDLQAKCKTLWLIHSNSHFVAPFGKVIHYEV
jgi:predicted metal-dependent peptidase